MSRKMPPVPPAERSSKGPGSDPAEAKNTVPHGKQAPQNLAEEGQRANIRQNTTNLGRQSRG